MFYISLSYIPPGENTHDAYIFHLFSYLYAPCFPILSSRFRLKWEMIGIFVFKSK